MTGIEEIRSALAQVAYPGFTKDIVSFGFVKNIEVGEKPHIEIEITASSDEIASILRDDIKSKLALIGVNDFELKINQPQAPKETSSKGKNIAPYIKNFIMISSGKGGVGKSTTTTNLAIALAMQGKKIGVLDADIYGPNIPRMFGVVGAQPEVVANRVKPVHALGCEVMSMGMLMEEGQSLIWRGAMIMKVIQQLLTDIEWGELDALIIDMPPGTGDAQLTLAQSVPVTCGVVVTTPQTVALDDAKRSLDMFEKLHIPLGGIVENMSGFICPESGKEYDIFGKGTAEELAKEYKTGVLAQIPIEVDTRKGGDEGKPITYYAPTSESAKRFLKAAATLWEKIEEINKEGGVSNDSIQPTIGLDGKTSACSSGGGHSGGGCGCH
ncbi:MAG: Mrp/NBP35 family ATP-binding protein [Campylobacteraceae bacterium]|jgi:ATP-binding protein involved in chromosome partitioning|nr:Mrp/NBP35 family ATP-binding protein [Campylobacteraceae bacterium]